MKTHPLSLSAVRQAATALGGNIDSNLFAALLDDKT